MASKRPVQLDAVDVVVGQWDEVRPDLEHWPVGIVGRVSRLSRLIDRRLAENFARHDLEAWMYDVLATLRRGGPPHALTAGDLVRQSMVTSGAITHRIDRLEQRGLVERRSTDDRRVVLVALTPAGLALVDEVVEGHLATERELLASLDAREREAFTSLLRQVLVDLGDIASPA